MISDITSNDLGDFSSVYRNNYIDLNSESSDASLMNYRNFMRSEFDVEPNGIQPMI